MNLEDKLQAAIVEFVRTVAPQCVIFSVPNGGLRSKREASRLKWTGVVAGVPDLILLVPCGRVACIEVKTKKGSLSEAQREFHARLITIGIPRVVARSIDDVRAALHSWQVETRETVLNNSEVK